MGGGNQNAGPNRRAVVRGIAGGVLASALPGAAMAQGRPLHLVAAEHAKRVAAGDTRPLVLLGPDGAGANLAPVMAKFHELTGIKVQLVEENPLNLNTRISLLAMTGNVAFDVGLPTSNGLPDLASTGVIQPFDHFVDTYEPPGFRDGSLYNVADKFDGKYFGFQTDGDVYLMYYKRAFLESRDEQAAYADRFGVPLGIASTWEELDQQMRWFHRPDQDQYGGLMFRIPGYFAWEWWSRFHAKGVWPFSPQMDAQIGGDAGIEALEDMVRATAYLHPATNQASIFENWNVFFKQNIFSNIGWGGAYKLFKRSEFFDPNAIVNSGLPGGQDPETGAYFPCSYFNWGKNYVVSASTDRPELAYLYCLFAASPVISTLSVGQIGGFFDPFREEHYADPAIQQVYGDALLQVHRQGMIDAIPDLYLKNQAEYFRVLDEAIAQAVAGTLTAPQAMTRAAQLWELITSRSGRAQQIKRWTLLREKYPQKVSQWLRNTS